MCLENFPDKAKTIFLIKNGTEKCIYEGHTTKGKFWEFARHVNMFLYFYHWVERIKVYIIELWSTVIQTTLQWYKKQL